LENFPLTPLKQIRAVPTNSYERRTKLYKTAFCVLAITFDSGVCFAHSLYLWKYVSEIYNFLVIWFGKFLTNCIHFFGLIYDTLLTDPKNMTPKSKVEEPRTELREAHVKYHLVNFLVIWFQMCSVNNVFWGYFVVTHPLHVEWCQVPMLRGGHTQHPRNTIYSQGQ
jgi:hypothetical protein